MKHFLRIILCLFACALAHPSACRAEDSIAWQVGDTVIIKLEVERYLTGEKMSKWVYYVQHTIQQVGTRRFTDGILLRGIYSWVGKDDIELLSSSRDEVSKRSKDISALSDAELAKVEDYARRTGTEVLHAQEEDTVLQPVDTPIVDTPIIIVDTPVVEIPVVDTPVFIVNTPVVEIPVVDTPVFIVDTPVVEIPVVDTPVFIVDTPVVEAPVEDSVVSFYLKTNLLYDLATVANLGLEIGFKGHYSIDLPVNFSPWTTHPKYRLRVFTVQPEFRYWFGQQHFGHHVGVHSIVGLYNVSFGDSHRYQTHRITDKLFFPALGVGISYGYSLWLDKKREHPNWFMEFNIGVGYVYERYDSFYNVPNGAMFSSGDSHHYFGPTKLEMVIGCRLGDVKKQQ